MKILRTGLSALIIATIAALAGCASDATSETNITVSDAWVRAVPELAEGNMTGVFMTIENPSDTDVYITGGTDTTGLTETPLEAHEVVADDSGEMVMQMAEDGILVPAHGSVQLKPGGFHIMYWEMTSPIAVGDTITFTLNVSDGSTIDVSAIAMTLDGGTEKYVPGDSGMEH